MRFQLKTKQFSSETNSKSRKENKRGSTIDTPQNFQANQKALAKSGGQ